MDWIHPALKDKAALLSDEIAALGQDDADQAYQELLQALSREAGKRLETFLTGIERYRSHPHHRQAEDGAIEAMAGSTALRSYAGKKSGNHPVLVIPSLVNRAYILDLDPGTSFMRFLAEQGFHPYLVDWGMPGNDERNYSLEDYIARLTGFLDHIRGKHSCTVAVTGYCMGGLLALAAGLERLDAVSGLALLATPWNFHCDGGRQAAMLALMMPVVREAIGITGFLPTDFLQMFFTGLDPLLALRKFSKFAASDPEGSFARTFVGLEDWLNDGVPLTGPAALDCLEGWYLENRTERGCWQASGTAINPGNFPRPSLCLIPNGDRIVPPASAMALAEKLPDCEIRPLQAGHIGMMAGSRAKSTSWPLIADFLKALS